MSSYILLVCCYRSERIKEKTKLMMKHLEKEIKESKRPNDDYFKMNFIDIIFDENMDSITISKKRQSFS
jgi:hypothetical protein